MAGMYSERLVVRNFGPITNLDIEFRRLTLFIGDQGSGKSTLSKLLTICRDSNWWLLMLENADAEDVKKPFYDFGINEYFMDDTFISYTMTGFSIKYENGVFSIESDYINAGAIKKYFQYLNKRYGSGQEGAVDETQAKELEPYARAVLYILAERNLVGNLSESLASMLTAQVPLPKPLMEYMSMFERAKKEYPSYNIPFFNVKFVKKNGKERIELVGKDKDLPLSACSSGLQSAIPMLMVIDYALKTESFNSFVIEEPEQNLFPQNQFEMLGFITSRLWHPSQRRQFIITTHSPYLLSSLNVLMLAYKLHHIDEVREEAEKIIVPGYTVNPDDVAVYSLDPNSEVYCKSLISEKTGLVSVNELDSVSEVIGDDFDRLYDLYRQVNKKK
jgi:predicted ATPase